MATFLCAAPIDPTLLLAEVADAAHGGTALFVGSVRAHHLGRQVVGLDYVAYDAMAEEVASRVLDEARSRWDVHATARHRSGRLGVGEVAIAVAAAGAHRAEAFAACRWLVDELKRRVPIWKHERYADCTAAWVDPTGGAGETE